MTDLTTVLPGFPTQDFVRLFPSLEKNLVTTADLLTLDCLDIAKRAQLPLPDLTRLCASVLKALQGDLGISGEDITEKHNGDKAKTTSRKSGKDILETWDTISTLDDDLDRALGGGVPAGYITEVTGESGSGKTQFLLTLLLAAQLPSPLGLSCSVLYISTESGLPTTRLTQLLRSHPVLMNADPKPALDAIISIVTPDLESQDHILRFQVPVAIKQYGIKLIVLDSVAANYRAEFERPGAGNGIANMAQRSSELVKLGHLLRDLARNHGIAIVVANQVADRFSPESRSLSGGSSNSTTTRETQHKALVKRVASNTMPDSSLSGTLPSIPPNTEEKFRGTVDPMSFDHQQRWFTGWGDEQYPSYLANKSQKTPSLGLIWTTQVACRIALIKRPVFGRVLISDEETDRGEPILRKWRRWMKVVFAPHASGSGPGITGSVEFEIKGEGLRAVVKKDKVEVEDGLIT